MRLTASVFTRGLGIHAWSRGFRNPGRENRRSVVRRRRQSSAAGEVSVPHRSLSVQVHPDDKYAANHGHGKTEMWHVLGAKPGARIAAGFREPITAERLREARSRDRRDAGWFDAAAGDTFFIPAGTCTRWAQGWWCAKSNSIPTLRIAIRLRPRELHLERAGGVSRPRNLNLKPVEHISGRNSGFLSLFYDFQVVYFEIQRKHISSTNDIPVACLN